MSFRRRSKRSRRKRKTFGMSSIDLSAARAATRWRR